MKQLLATAALALSFAVSMSAISTTAIADPHYYVVKGTGPGADGKVEIRSRAHGEGTVDCVIGAGNYLHRNHEQNWSRYIHVQWKLDSPWETDRYADVEWKYKDARGKWCAFWFRKGWIDKADPDLRLVVGWHPDDPGSLRPVPDTWTSTVHTTGQWGNDVPVFRDMDTYFQARESLEANGNYRHQENRVNCRLRQGMKVVFAPHKNWGVGQVWRAPNSNQGCSGWIDRGVIRQN